MVCVWSLQIYTGRYRPPRQRENPVETVEDHLHNIEVGKFVAVNLSNCDKVPIIGKVLEVHDEEVKVHYWKGSFKGKWSPQNALEDGLHGWMISQRHALFCLHFH